MVFSSLFFLFGFLPLTILIYMMSPLRVKNLWLLTASLIFYAWGEGYYVIIMLASIFLNYFSGYFLEPTRSKIFREVKSEAYGAANTNSIK